MSVPGDGHCLLHAFLLGLQNQDLGVSDNELCDRVLDEIHGNWTFYKQFHPAGCDILKM